MYPWNNQLWLYARSQNYNPGTTSLHTRHRSGYVEFLTQTSHKNSTESDNPLLLVATTGEPSRESERYFNPLRQIERFLMYSYRSINSWTIQGGGCQTDEIPDDNSLISEEETC